MDVIDQLHALRAGKLSRRAFNRSLLALGIVPAMCRCSPAARRPHPRISRPGSPGAASTFPTILSNIRPSMANCRTSPPSAGRKRRSTSCGRVSSPMWSHPCLSGVPRWIESGLFQPIDTSRLSNWPDVIPELRCPKTWRTASRGWCPSTGGRPRLPTGPTSSSCRARKAGTCCGTQRYAGRLGMLCGGRRCLVVWGDQGGRALRPRSTRDEAFDKIAAVMRAQRPLIRIYTDDTTSLEQALAAGELVAAMTWNCSA